MPPAHRQQPARDEPNAQPQPAAEREPARGPSWPLVFLFFFVAAVVQTWPLALHMNDHVMGWAGDSYVMWWNLATVKDAVLGLSNPFHTNALYYPQGTSLYLHTLIAGNGVLSIPLQLITGNVLLTANLMSLSFIALSGTGAYAVALRVSRDRWASLFAGFLFAFSPFIMMHLSAAHVNIATTWPLPFFVLCLLRFFERRSRVDLVIVALLAAFMTWNWIEFAIDGGLFALLLFGYWAVGKVRRREGHAVLALCKALAPGVLIWAVLSIPIVVPMANAINSGDYTVTTGSEASHFSPDVAAYFIPSPLWGPGEHAVNYQKPYSTRAGSVETTMFLGLTPLVLAGIAFANRKRFAPGTNVGFWAATFGFFAVMSLGPQLHMWGVTWPVPLPFRVLQEFPLLGSRQEPARMIIVGTLALGVLGALGIRELARRREGTLRHAGPIIACVVLGMLFLEFFNAPVSLASYHVPPVYQQIGQEGGRFSVLDLPLGRATGNSREGDAAGAAMSDYAQIIHGHASIGGYLSRVPDADVKWLAEQPGLGYLACLSGTQDTQPITPSDCTGYPRAIDRDTARVEALLDDLQVKYAVLNLVTFEGDATTLAKYGRVDEAEAYLKSIRFVEIESGDGWTAYRNPRVDS